jgi:hypothetical protein
VIMDTDPVANGAYGIQVTKVTNWETITSA